MARCYRISARKRTIHPVHSAHMNRSFAYSAMLLAFFAPVVTHAAPVIGPVTPITATAGVPVNLSASVSSGVAIQSCTLWVDLAEIGAMTVDGSTASRVYTFPNGGSRIAFVFCRDTSGGMSAGATTAITVSGAIQNQAPLSVPSQTTPSTPIYYTQPTITTPSPMQTAPTSAATSTTPLVTLPQTPSAYVGKLLKTACPAGSSADHACRAVYYIGKDGARHAFPNSQVFFTWYSGFDSVQEVSATTLSNHTLGANVVYRGGVRMVKFTTDPKVYAVARGGALRWITSESLARAFYGDTWNKKIDDIPDTFYDNYTFGEQIDSTADYNPEAEFEGSKE